MTALALTVLVASTLGGVSNAPSCPTEVYEYAWPVDQACSVSWCESRWTDDVGATNRGLFQLWTGWADYYGVPRSALYDRRTNVSLAYLVWRDHGRWSAWSCKP